MIELLILYVLHNKVLTMYGISKEIHSVFSVLTMPSFGTIKPALKRLEEANFLKTKKELSNGGRRAVYYSITKEGINEFKRMIVETPIENTAHFLTAARVKLYCANLLSKEELPLLFSSLKLKAQCVMADTENILKTKKTNFYSRMVYDNLICEYKNFISLLEGFEHAGNN